MCCSSRYELRLAAEQPSGDSGPPLAFARDDIAAAAAEDDVAGAERGDMSAGGGETVRGRNGAR